MSAKTFCIIVTSTDNKEHAERIAANLIEKGLAACVHIHSNVKSVYRWEGCIHEENEYILHIKSKSILFERICDDITAQHHYDTPEIIAIPIDAISDTYARWMSDEIRL